VLIWVRGLLRAIACDVLSSVGARAAARFEALGFEDCCDGHSALEVHLPCDRACEGALPVSRGRGREAFTDCATVDTILTTRHSTRINMRNYHSHVIDVCVAMAATIVILFMVVLPFKIRAWSSRGIRARGRLCFLDAAHGPRPHEHVAHGGIRAVGLHDPLRGHSDQLQPRCAHTPAPAVINFAEEPDPKPRFQISSDGI
jgi:hypothetical protein